MKINADIAALLAATRGATLPPVSMDERRLQFAAELAVIDEAGPSMGLEVDLTIQSRGGALPGRLFDPDPDNRNKPLLVFLHGGGWIQGSITTHASICRYLAHGGQMSVLSAEYRLAPEHGFPAPVEDALDILRWAQEHSAELRVSVEQVMLAGDSAGGNLAAAATLLAREESQPGPAALLLLYPALDLAGTTSSRETFRTGYWLDSLDELIELYVPCPTNRLDPRASPARAPSLKDFPPTMVVVAGFDPLRDEGVSFANRLAKEGIRCRLIEGSSMIHGFLSLQGIVPNCREALQNISQQFGLFARVVD